MSGMDLVEIEFIGEEVQLPKITVEKQKRKSARHSPKLIVKINVFEDGEHFEDTLILKTNIPLATYKIFMEMQKNIPDEAKENMDPEAIMSVLEMFPDFIKPMIESATFEVDESNLMEMDTNIQLSLIGIVFKTIQEQRDTLAKK